ncbi:LOW QUALITY PROTEIN: zinc finger protein CONSTANS-LIKE 2-like [Phoenix dactylifera]|uniref:LOW QUALITY PROTEIN: zinc finger protein CONSTANS-LIKE 2-like n=1 Tax=Phoenix dactylifera TaxID=42345 RepID=A0A8B8JA67_PHODC|nr:LOW QUALITY PROTEIN: zinc finger protein CONSTANS-LIKE 2-like [Phoenix dactylifera]
MNSCSSACMFEEEGSSAAGGGNGGGGGGGKWMRTCDSCQSEPSTVYCLADAAYLCVGCDSQVHTANRVASWHERVGVCEVCEPATLTRRADAAALCAACDADVHSANRPLAGCHHRVPILPLPPDHLGPGPGPPFGGKKLVGEEEVNHDDGEAMSWLLVSGNCNQTNNSGFLFGPEVDEYLDLLDYNDSCNENQNQEQQQQQQNYGRNEGSECVVPSQRKVVGYEAQQQNYGMEKEHDNSNAGFSYTTASLGHGVSFSPMEASVVPDTTMTNISSSHIRPSTVTTHLVSSNSLQMPPQFTAMNREARILRYREKKKTRKLEKRIRYASRKVNAETRPRIKGRFAKRSDIELDVDQMFSSSLIFKGSDGIVPSFLCP